MVLVGFGDSDRGGLCLSELLPQVITTKAIIFTTWEVLKLEILKSEYWEVVEDGVDALLCLFIWTLPS